MPPEELVPVDVISADQLAKVMAGMKTGKKENPKPLVEKVAEAKPRRRCRRQDHREAAGGDRDRAAAAAEGRGEAGREEARSAEGRRGQAEGRAEAGREEAEPEVDPIAEAIKKEEKKPPPKPVQAAKPPEPAKPKIVERHFDQTQIAALLDKRDPTRQAATGDTLNSNAALGLAKGTAADNSATWGSMFQRQVERCWKKPYGGIEITEIRGRVCHPV